MFFVLYGASPIFGIDFNDKDPYYVSTLIPATDGTAGKLVDVATGKTIVYTLAFQTFVFMQLFNQINARKLGRPADKIKGTEAVEEYNVF